jgi:tRNA modification GTPase
MFAPGDTIVAIATPAGHGGIGVVRISGAQAPRVAQAILDVRCPLDPRRATFARVRGGPIDRPGSAVDEVVVTWFSAPSSYTGEHVIEISAHGSPVVLRAIVARAMDAGARMARPGEFTLRAFLNGKRDLVQAEAVADLIAAATPLQARVAFDQLEGTLTRRIAAIDATLFDLIVRLEASLDFPDEGYHFVEPGEVVARIDTTVEQIDTLLADAVRGRMIREGVSVVVVGRTNVGKSSLFNALAGTDRAIVTDVAGTTRDLVTEHVDIEGLEVTLVDTAGARQTADVVEREGVLRGEQARRVANLLLLVLDQSEPLTAEDEVVLRDTACLPRLIVANKCDQPGWLGPSDRFVTATADPNGSSVPVNRVSAATGEGIPVLRHLIATALTGTESLRDTAAVSNARHVELLREARDYLACAQAAASAAATPEELLLLDLQSARKCFDEIVGTRTTDDVLERVFERFCIGK